VEGVAGECVLNNSSLTNRFLVPFLSRSSLTRDAGIYGIITAIIINGKIESPDEDGACKYSVFTGYAHLAAGLCVGLASMASGISLGIASDAGVRANGAQSCMSANWKKMGFSASDGQNSVMAKGDSLFVAGVLIQGERVVFVAGLGDLRVVRAPKLTQMRRHFLARSFSHSK
jgi:V-type H+-transporting ATPase proteolipid subunit